MNEYKEPELSIVCLDYCKPIESKILLESIKRHVKFPHKVIFVDNGSNESYSYEFLKSGLVDQLIINRESNGLGVGTRDCFNAVTTKYALSAQNDQVFVRDFNQDEFDYLKNLFGAKPEGGGIISTISLAGSPCGPGVYSERSHLILTEQYKIWEKSIPLSFFGAGKFHDGVWREAQIQELYRQFGRVHFEHAPIMVADNGVFAVRDMGDCGIYCHRTDTKRMWVIVRPLSQNPAYPKVTDEEFSVIWRGEWEDGRIPEQELEHSFDCWSNTQLGRMEKEYIANLRERFKNKAHP